MMQPGAAAPSGILALEDGTILAGRGFGGAAVVTGELVFNTAMTGYQEILTDPSYAGQIVTFTFPHIGNVGTNDEDREALTPAVRGMVTRAPVTRPSSWRDRLDLVGWLERHGIPGIAGDRHKAGHPAVARPGRAQGLPRPCAERRRRPARAGREGPRLGRHRGCRSGARGRGGAALRLGRGCLGSGHRLRPERRQRAAHRRRGLRRQAQHPALARPPRLSGDGGALHHAGASDPGAGTRRRGVRQRPGRPGGHRRPCRAGDPGR